MGYIFEKKIQFAQVVYTGRLFRQAIRKDMSFNAFQRQMQDRKLSYKRLDMLADWNRAKAVEHARTYKAQTRAIKWYDGIALPNMKKRGLTPTEFFGWLKKGQGDMFDTLEEMEEWLEYEEEVEDEFEEIYGYLN
jgi:hypothetical protein